MDPACVTLKPLRSELHYRSKFEEIAWGLLTIPVPLYQGMLKHLSPFGATLQSLRVETASLADAQVSCSLLDLNAAIRVRLDRVEFDCWKLHEVGSDAAQQVLRAVWAAIHEADDSIRTGAHIVDLNIVAEVVGSTSAQLLSRYVRIPEALGTMETGVAFYTPPITSNDEAWVNLVLDRIFKEDTHILAKMTVGCAASAVSIDSVAQSVEHHLTRVLENVGLRLQTELT
jgi:hypothetical protein